MWTVSSAYERARKAAEQDAENCRRTADYLLEIYEGHLPGMSREEIGKILAESNQERLDAVPDLNKYPELRGVREIVEAEWRGLRDGAKLTDAQWAASCNGLFHLHRHISGDIGRETGCSSVFFPESDRGPILANNLDSAPSEPFGAPGWAALNEHLVMQAVSSGIFGDELSPEIFPVPMDMLLGRYTRSTDEAVEMLERYNFFWGPCNAMVIDRDHHVAMIEKSACRIGVRRSPDGFGFVTEMTAEEPSMRAYLAETRAASLKARDLPEECSDTVHWRDADHRRELMQELLDEARKNPTLEGLRRIIQFRDPKRGKVCYNGEILTPGGPPCNFTLRTTIWLLREGRAMWWAKEGDKPSFENRKEDIEFKDVLLWD